jgi:hypothetical protein
MRPIALAVIPGAPAVITAPIVANTERNDADAKLGAKFQHRYAAAIVIVEKVIAVDPAAIAFPIDIAPGPVIQTTADIQQGVGRD